MLFPVLSPQYYDERHKAILTKMEAEYAAAITLNQSFWGEADTDMRFFTGDQTLWNDLYGNLPANRRRQFTFNRIMRIVNMVSGHQRRNRKSTVATPIENGDAFTADQFTKIFLWLNKQEGILETVSESFLGSLICGMNLLEVWMDYRQDPISGNIRVDNCAYNSFLIDPYFKKPDLSDCNFVWKRSFLSKRECISLLPDYTEEILGLIGNDSGTGRDGKFQFMAESYNYGLKNLLTYDQYFYRDYRTQKMLADTQTGETMEWRSNDDEKLRLYLQTYPTVKVIEQEIPTVRLAVVVQGKVMYDGPNPMGIDKYPFVPVFCYYHPEMPYFPWRIQGVVRGLRDAQYLYNRRKVIELDILESQINSGFIYKENALVNPKDIWQLSGQGKGLAIKEEAQMTDVVQMQSPNIPSTTIELSRILAQEMPEISGVNEELLGTQMESATAFQSMLRQGAGLTTLQPIFDQLDRSQKLLGQIMLELIQVNFTPGKVKKILEGQEPSQQFYNKAFGKYDIVIEDGLNTSTQKQMQFAQMLNLREAGVPISNEDLLEASTFQNKNKIVENIQKQQQAQQQQVQQQAEVQMQLLQAQANLANKRAGADEGLEWERKSRVPENRAMAIKQIHEANAADERALLDKVKVLKELEEMDLSHIEKLLNMANSLKAAEQQNAVNPNENNKPAQNGSVVGRY